MVILGIVYDFIKLQLAYFQHITKQQTHKSVTVLQCDSSILDDEKNCEKFFNIYIYIYKYIY